MTKTAEEIANEKEEQEMWAMMKPYKDIIPDALEKELREVIKAKDLPRVDEVSLKIAAIVKDYTDRVCKVDLNEGEEILWMYRIQKGIFHQELVESWIITDLRAMKHFPVTKNRPEAKVQSAPLLLCDSLIMNQHRKSKGNRVGTYTGIRGTGTSVSSSSSTSLTYGDLVFIRDGKESLRFSGISDPHGVRRLVETVKKQKKV